ncbi:glycine/D-amino acid oxidase-like deaminating enzyme [Primorskyibacter sedentarius]|uniref:Glycine/D-amino acid oxidase-like deaminating enzyme n=1 Tax=Primorskyibacter sedentarius TaxID=745311 RepID=A0A4R3IX55_9RHOB|nr:FAD-binding oxidoreductase [Primorskyibacter sedentarius]TCS55259.1 glycine/D-amino acid oxidase-like deaminating enzyme [Primorskyibacter sedentarius]
MSIFTNDVKLEPYWWEAAPRPNVRPAPETLPARADVVIVGSGYTGLNAGLALAEAGVDVVILEAEELGKGASTRNGGAIGATLRHSFASLLDRIGTERAIAQYASAIASREYVIDLVTERGFDCDLSRCGRFYGAHKAKDIDGLSRDLDARKTHLGSEATVVSPADQQAYVGTQAYHGGRFHPEDGHLHPGLYHQCLLNAARAAGAAIHGHTRVTDITRAAGGFTVTTGTTRIQADRVIVATNGYTGKEFGWFRRRLVPIQSQIIATEELDPALLDKILPNDYQVGDTCKLHNYFRRSPDGRRILFGGRSGASQVNDFRKSGASLHNRMTGLFPELANAKITHTWGGFIAFSFDHTPHFTEKDGIHYIGGCCGSGVAMMSYLGHQTALKLLGREFDTTFHRDFKPQAFYSGNPWFMPAIITALEWRDRMKI